MSADYYVQGFIPPDERFREMKAVYDTCKKAGIDIPQKVSEFFNHEEPDENGVSIDLELLPCCKEAENGPGFIIDIDKLPKDVKVIKFYVSY